VLLGDSSSMMTTYTVLKKKNQPIGGKRTLNSVSEGDRVRLYVSTCGSSFNLWMYVLQAFTPALVLNPTVLIRHHIINTQKEKKEWKIYRQVFFSTRHHDNLVLMLKIKSSLNQSNG